MLSDSVRMRLLIDLIELQSAFAKHRNITFLLSISETGLDLIDNAPNPSTVPVTTLHESRSGSPLDA